MQITDLRLSLIRLETILGAPAYLAGGAIRDTYHARPIKDFDIFVPAETLDGIDFTTLEPAFGPDWQYTHHIPDEYFEGNMAEECGPIAVFEKLSNFDFLEGYVPPIQLIGLKAREGREWGPEAVLGRIDIGLCRALLNARGDTLVAPEFITDSRQQTLTIVDKRDPERSLKRAKRIQEKYPEFTIVP